MKKFMGIITSLFLLTACGGGSGGGDPETPAPVATTNVSANGFWAGQGLDGGLPFDAFLIAHDGELMAITTSVLADNLYYGGFSVSGNEISGQVAAYLSTTETAQLTGTVSEKNVMDLSFTTSYDTSGTMTLTYDDIYERPSALATVAGTWAVDGGGQIVIAADGSLTGSGDCTLDGQVSVLDPQINLYGLDVVATGCSDVGSNGTYSGLAALYDEVTYNDGLQFLAAKDDRWLYFPSVRQTEPNQLFSLDQWQDLTPGTVYSAQISGSDSEGRIVTGAFSVANREAVMRNSILVTPVDLLISLAIGNEPITINGTSYVNQDGYTTEVYTEGITCTPVSYGKMPATVKVGDFGILPEVECNNSTTMTQNWRAESAGANKISIVAGTTTKNLDNAILATTEQTITLGANGDILGYKMVSAADGYSINFTSN